MLARFLIRNAKARFRDQRPELSALLGALRPGDVALDVGAHKGSHLLWLSRAVGRAGRVIAFEPQAGLADTTRRACAQARLRNVTVEHAAVGDQDGEANLHIPESSSGSPVAPGSSPEASLSRAVAARERGATQSVRVVALDTYLAEERRPIRALKIDVEGHEHAVFAGAARILAEHSPLLVFECERRHLAGRSIEDVLAPLRALGYDGHFVRAGALVPLVEFDADTHQRQVGARYWDRADYSNNFILQRSR